MSIIRFVPEARRYFSEGRTYQSRKSWNQKEKNPYLYFKLCSGQRNLRFRLEDLNNPCQFRIILNKIAMPWPNTLWHITDLCNFYFFFMGGLKKIAERIPQTIDFISRINKEVDKNEKALEALKGHIIKELQYDAVNQNLAAVFLALETLTQDQIMQLPNKDQITINTHKGYLK